MATSQRLLAAHRASAACALGLLVPRAGAAAARRRGAPSVESLAPLPTQRLGDAARAGVLEPFAAKLELVGAVLGCAAQLLRVDAIVPVRTRAEPGLASRAGLGMTARPSCSESDGSDAEGSASDEEDERVLEGGTLV